MIKILATSDWHLGNIFHDRDREDEYIHFFEWLKNVISSQQPDVMLVAGDVFDNSNPSATSQQLYYSFLTHLRDIAPDMQTIIIAGNHDSASRLEAPRELLQTVNAQVRGIIPHKDGIPCYDNFLISVTNKAHDEKAWIMAIPFLRDGDYERVDSSYDANVKGFFMRMIEYADKKRNANEALLLMAHLYAKDSMITPDSEKIYIGGAEYVDISDMDDMITLGVFGHIHRRQLIGKKNNLRYIGSALPMSFGERGYRHGAEIYTIEKGILNEEDIEFAEYPPLHPLRTIAGEKGSGLSLKEIIERIELLDKTDDKGHSPYLEIVVNNEDVNDSLFHTLEEKLNGRDALLCRIQKYISTSNEETEEQATTYRSIEELTADPTKVILERYHSAKGIDMNEEKIELINRAIAKAKEE